MHTSPVRALVLSALILAAACTSSTGPSTPETAIDGTYQLKTVRGTALPVALFGQCSLGAGQPCSACTASATSGTLTLKNNPRDFTLSLVASGLCTDPLGRSPTLSNSYTISAGGSWSTWGSAGVALTSNNMNLASASVSGTSLCTSFDWVNAYAGGQTAAV